MINQRELAFASVSGLIALIALAAMPLLVAKPKLLFGRSLSAIPPTLFPYVTLTLIAALSGILIVIAFRQLRAHRRRSDNLLLETSVMENNWMQKASFFVLLSGYGLLLKPIGFLISSVIVISATSLLLGNRNWSQIGLLAVLSPICLYLIATRVMLVSLPELDRIELSYSHLITWSRALVGR